MRKRLIVVSLVVAALAIAAFGTASYFTSEGTAKNAVTAGNADIQVYTDYPSEGQEILPGDTVKNTASVKNTGDHPVYLRVKLTKGVSDSSLSADTCLELDINTAYWTYKDGYYYYNTALDAGATTEPLFTEVRFSGENIDNQYLGKRFTLDVDASAVQSENNGASVWDAAGFPGA